jgi:hypothetical protein
LSEVENEKESYDIPESSDLFDVVEPSVGDNANSSVKVLSKNMASRNKNSDIKDRQKINFDSDALFNEFQKILSPKNAGGKTEKGNGRNQDNLPPGILTI